MWILTCIRLVTIEAVDQFIPGRIAQYGWNCYGNHGMIRWTTTYRIVGIGKGFNTGQQVLLFSFYELVYIGRKGSDRLSRRAWINEYQWELRLHSDAICTDTRAHIAETFKYSRATTFPIVISLSLRPWKTNEAGWCSLVCVSVERNKFWLNLR